MGILSEEKNSIFDIPSFLFIRLEKSIGLGAQNEGGGIRTKRKVCLGKHSRESFMTSQT